MLEKEIGEYLSWKGSYTKSAANRYELHLTRFDKFCKKEISRIVATDIVNFHNNLNLKYSPANVYYAMTIIKDFMGWNFRQVDEKGRRVCHLDPALVRLKKVSTNHHYPIPEKEYLELINSLRDDEFWHAQRVIVIRLLWETGVRVSELCSLNIADVSNENRSALIVTKKGYEKGWIFWSEETHRIVQNFLGVRLCMNSRPNLFITQSGRNRPTTRTIERWVAQAVKESGIKKKITPHSFRHGKAHYILDQGGGVADVAKILRHSEKNPMAAFAYLRLNHTEIDKIAQKFL